MTVSIRHRLPVGICLVTLGMLAVPDRGTAQGNERAPSVTPPADTAILYVINDSGKTLMAGKQTIKDNDKELASLPRHTYQRCAIPPGLHVLRPSSLKKPQVRLEAAPGMTYYVVVAYRPEHSWGAPFGGSPLVLAQISEEEARKLMAEMTEYTRGAPSGK